MIRSTARTVSALALTLAAIMLLLVAVLAAADIGGWARFAMALALVAVGGAWLVHELTRPEPTHHERGLP